MCLSRLKRSGWKVVLMHCANCLVRVGTVELLSVVPNGSIQLQFPVRYCHLRLFWRRL